VARSLKISTALLLILFFTCFAIYPISSSDPIEAAQISPKNTPPPPYGGGVPVGEYWGIGNPTSILATYNKTMSTPTATDDASDFTVSLPVDWETAFNASFSGITAGPIVLDIETDDSTSEGSHTIRAAMSLQITNSCHLHSVMVRVEADAFDLLDTSDDLYVRIYNAT